MNDSSERKRQLFVVPASGTAAASHLADSILSPISKIDVSAFLTPAEIAVIEARTPGEYYAWGAKPGPGNRATWTQLSPEDYILFYQNGEYTFEAQVVLKSENADLAADLWGVENGETFSLLYF